MPFLNSKISKNHNYFYSSEEEERRKKEQSKHDKGLLEPIYKRIS